MQISATGLSFICRFEGFSAVPYVCPAGLLTIGYGHVIARGEHFTRLDTAAATELLEKDVRLAAKAVLTLISVPLMQHQFDALVSFTFNLGAGALQRSRLRAVINRGEHDAAPHEFMRWVYAGGRRLPGLLARRRAEAKLYQRIQAPFL